MTSAPLLARIRRGLIVSAIGLFGLICLLYVGDYARLRYEIAKNHEPFGSIKVQHYYAVKLKSGKLEYYFDTPQMQQCSHSLFPQMGYTPCWYLQRQADKGTNI